MVAAGAARQPCDGQAEGDDGVERQVLFHSEDAAALVRERGPMAGLREEAVLEPLAPEAPRE